VRFPGEARDVVLRGSHGFLDRVTRDPHAFAVLGQQSLYNRVR
jgi:hypothetical protein